MSTLNQKFPYILFYVNDEGKYETAYPKTIWGIPQHLKIEGNYVYTPHTFGYDNKFTNWIHFIEKPMFTNHTSRSWTWLYKLDEIPHEVRAMVLLMDFK